jgi:uncharacterized protein
VTAVTETAAARRRPVQAGLLAAVRFYQRAISPTRPPRCRFVPTCSDYALEAVQVHGALRGGWLALRRLLKCAPWHPGGVDLVPGTSGPDRASSTTADPQLPGDPRPTPTTPQSTPPGTLRAAQEESSLA